MTTPVETLCNIMLVTFKTKRALLNDVPLLNWKTKTALLRAIDLISVIFVDLYVHKYM